MRVAVLSSYLDNIGGAEKVSLTIARELKADVYSTSVDQSMISRQGFRIKPKSIGEVPASPPFRQQLTLSRFRKLKLDHDFFIISGEWAISAAVNNKPNLWYVHSPARELWDLYSYKRKNLSAWQRPLFDLWVKYNRKLNLKYAGEVETIVSNSKNVQERVRKYLGRESSVIHPPVDTKNFCYKKPAGYWLSVSRLLPQKGIEVQLDAFRKLPDERLIIVGSYDRTKRRYAKHLKKVAFDNVSFLDNVSAEKIRALYSECIGVITTSMDEDFGLTAVEAMASGKPVIAPASGGYRETIIDGITGSLLENAEPKTLIQEIKAIGNNPQSYRNACLARAKKFDTSIFVKKLKEQVFS